MTKREQPNLSAEHLIFPNPYRIGDAVALMTLRAWIEARHGKKTWYLAQQNDALPILSKFVPGGMKWFDPNEKPLTRRHIAGAPDDAEVFDDGNLWIWNDVFHKEGFRLDWEAPSTEQRYRIIFAPLPEVDYGTERAMQMTFVEQVAKRLTNIEGVVVLLPETMSTHDWRRLRRTGATLLTEPSLERAITLIGNCGLFIGGDTGFSHIAGCFPSVQQISLHSKEKTDRHNEMEFDHLQDDREYTEAISGVVGMYRATPNKQSCRDIFFEHGGMDGKSFAATMRAIDESMEVGK
mgnify:CR=1 FL=1